MLVGINIRYTFYSTRIDNDDDQNKLWFIILAVYNLNAYVYSSFFDY